MTRDDIASKSFAPINTASCLAEVHLLQYRPTEEPVGIRQRFDDLEVVVLLSKEELNRLARGTYCSSEIARLALEFRSLQRPIGDD